MNMIEVQDLRKSYAGRQVVRDVSLNVAEGEVFGILGPNGAGKTTTVEMIGGLRRPDSGWIRVGGLDPSSESRELRELIGMQLQEARQPAKMTVRESLNLYRSFYRKPRDTEELLERFGLTEKANSRFEHLSGGQQQRLSVALALVGNPRVAILDELTTGLDPAARREIWTFLQDLVRDGVTILLVTHSMEEAQFLCDRVAIISDGTVTATGSPGALATQGSACVITFNLQAGTVDGISDLPGVMNVSKDGSQVQVQGTESSAQAVLTHLTKTQATFNDLRINTPSLDDAYVRLTRKETDR